MKRPLFPALAFLTLTLAACGQETTSVPVIQNSSSTPSAPGTAASTQAGVTLSIPAPLGLAAQGFNPQYVNRIHTTRVDVQVDGNAATSYTLGSVQAPCGPSVCTISLGVLSPDSHTFAVSTYGVDPGTGTTVMISQGSATQTLIAGQNTNLAMTLTPVGTGLGLKSAVQQYNSVTKTFGNYVKFSTLGGRSLPAYYDIQGIDSVGDVIPSTAAINAVLCGDDSSVVITNISDATHANRFRVEVQALGTHTLTVQSGTTCTVGGAALASQTVSGNNPNVASNTTTQTITGGYLHSLALLSDGTVKAWGSNSNGQLGNGATTQSTTPVTVSGLSNVISVTTGVYHSLALLSDGTVKAWGSNSNGQLGNGATTQSTTPVTVSGLSNVISVAGNYYHSVALLADGTVRAWGYNAFGQLGNGTTTQSTTPVTVSGLSNVSNIETGLYDSLALLSDGTVKAWGYNAYGQLGDGTTIQRTLPVSVVGLTNAVGVGGGYQSSMALLSDGTVKAWGYNGNGQLGNGTTINSLAPVVVSGLSNVTSIAGNYYHNMALLSDGTVKTWGYNTYGQLGDGTTIQRTLPVTVSGLSNVTSIDAGIFHSVALLADGTVRTWGYNSNGQLGNGLTTNSNVPVTVTGLSGVAQPSP